MSKRQIESWCPGVPVACQKHVDQAKVELDELRKNFELAMAERDLERHQKEMRHQAWLEACDRNERLIEAGRKAMQERDEALKGNGWLVIRCLALEEVVAAARKVFQGANPDSLSEVLGEYDLLRPYSEERPAPMCQDPVDGAGEGRPT